MIVSCIAAVAENGVIGRDNELPWRLSADLKRFKKLTMGHHLIMGRKTYESIGGPLPGRTSIVITRNRDYQAAPGVLLAHSFEEALRRAEGEEEVFVIGGASVYREGVARADRLYLTRVHADVSGDTLFPAVDLAAWKIVREDFREADSKNLHAQTFRIYERSRSTGALSPPGRF
jgi:dihydrofolate reductase